MPICFVTMKTLRVLGSDISNARVENGRYEGIAKRLEAFGRKISRFLNLGIKGIKS